MCRPVLANMKTSLTLFSNYDTLGPAHVTAVLTVCLADGWKYVFKVSLAVLSALQDQLLGSDFEGMMRILQHPHSLVSRTFPHPRDLMRAADSFKVTHKKLRQLEGRARSYRSRSKDQPRRPVRHRR